ncbi:MAG TPA: hypothetical protein VIH17_13725 [Candidatus Acidoferrales bacterium]
MRTRSSRKLSRLIKAAVAIVIIGVWGISLSHAKPEYSKKESKACTYCHIKMGTKELNDAGKCYAKHNHSLEGCKAEAK